MKSLSFLIVIIFTMYVSTITQAQDLNSATYLTRSEQYDQAKVVYEQLLQKEPKNSKNYYFFGENYLLEFFADTISNSFAVASKEAKNMFEKGIQANPNDPLNYIGLAKIAFYEGDNRTANKMRAKAQSFLLPFKKIKKIKPPAPDYAFALAKIAESYIIGEKVDTSLAMPLIRKAISIYSKNRDIFLIAGDIFLYVKDGSNAIKSYNRAQYCDPQSPTANMKIGSIYVKAKSYSVAIPYFEEAIKLKDNYAPAYRELGQLYATVGKYEKSQEYYKKYLELTQGNIPAKIRYITSLFYAKEYDEVVKNVEEIIKIDNSRTYMNRIAGYSCYEKDPPDYYKALAFMDTLFTKVSSERIIKKDYHYLAKILLGKNQNYQELCDQNEKNKTQLLKFNKTYKSGNKVEKSKLKPLIDSLSISIEMTEKQISIADKEIERAFDQYEKLMSFDSTNKNILNEIAVNNYRFRRYEQAAKTWDRLISLGKNDVADYMQVGKTFYVAGNYHSADSIFRIVMEKFPDFIDAYIYSARTSAKLDPEFKSDKALSKFKLVIEKIKEDSLDYANYLVESCDYLGYFHLIHDDFNKSKEYYLEMINLDDSNNEYKIKGYTGIGAVDLRIANKEQSNEGKLVSLKNASNAYKKILSIDPNNDYAISLLKYIKDYETQVKKGINPNEIKGVVKNTSGQPIQYASVRVKDTAAESYTNGKGEFKFEIPMGSEDLIIMATGYQTQEIPIIRPLKPLIIIMEQ